MLKKKKKTNKQKKNLFSSRGWAVLGVFPQAEAMMSTDSEPCDEHFSFSSLSPFVTVNTSSGNYL